MVFPLGFDPPGSMPLYLTEGFEAVAKVAAWGEFGELTLNGLYGTDMASGEPMFALTCERPTRVRDPLSKVEKELDDARQFLRAVGVPEDGVSLAPGVHANDPPDTVATGTFGEVGIEVTQLTLPTAKSGLDGMSRWYAFERLCDHMARDSARLAGAMRQHRGRMVWVWFGLEEGSDWGRGLPSRRDGIADLVTLLRTSAPPPRQSPRHWRPGPPTAPLCSSDDGKVGLTWSTLPVDYTSPMVTMFGFELGLAYTNEVRRSDVRAQLHHLVRQHDDPRVNVLLVTVNAALRSGLYFPSSEMVARLVMEDPEPMAALVPQHIREVALFDPAGESRVRWAYGDGGCLQASDGG